MRIDPDLEKEDPLLDAVLRNENWASTNANFKAEAMSAFRARQRQRRVTRWGGCIVALAAGVLCAAHWLGRSPASPQPQVIVQRPEPTKGPERTRYLTDEELLASFPKGSCVLVEIDGKKELVFLDANLERTYLARSD